ncbi:MAG: T9SS type A sorting domain-containing protein [Flavobacteriaceae bacterium]|nr:T9SS type A sorting domain-containing protein [Bacteroidia bacterium]NNK82106.1 T9SS type A sorting domain-containing protein [Flavobacteriaceae bacterium]
MKKTTLKNSKNLAKRLSKYGALTVAIAGVSDATGQIIYTDVDPDYASADVNIGLDLDNDSNFDFVIGDFSSAPAIALFAYNSAVGNSWLGSNPSFNYPFALNSGDTISSGLTSWYGGTYAGTLNYASCYGGIGSSNWCGVTDKFLGLRFQTGGQTYYGWAKLDVSLSGDQFILKEYAYNSTPGASINAGQTLSINDNALSKVRITALNKTIALNNLPNNSNYKLYTMTGQVIMDGDMTGNINVIEASHLANGVYLIEINDVNTKAVIRKKIIL